jgi:hypothetical protein
VVIIAGEDSPTRRYVSWLADTYETRLVHHRETATNYPEADVVVIDRRTLTAARGTPRENISWKSDNYRVLSIATEKVCDRVVDEHVTGPVGRDELLERVGTARSVVAYDNTISELLSLTTRRLRLRNRTDTDHVSRRMEDARLSERIDELHRRIEETLPEVESRYPELLV